MGLINLWLSLFVALAAQQVVSSNNEELRDVANVIDGSPLKPLSFIENSITKDIDLLAEKIGKPSEPINYLRDIIDCFNDANEVIKSYEKMFSLRMVTIARINQRNSIERATALLRALPKASQTCDLVSYVDLVAILKGAAGASGKLKSSDRIRSSIVAAIRLHRDHCSSGYYDRFQVALSAIGANVKDSIARLFDLDLIEEIFPGINENSMVLFETKGTPETLIRISQPLLERINKATDNNLLGRDMDTLSAKILDEQLFEPCKSYIEPLEGILLPAKIDMALKDSTSLSKLDPKLQSDQQLIIGWARFHICSSIHYNEPMIREALIDELSKVPK